MRLKKRRMEMRIHMRTFLPQVVAMESVNFIIPSVTSGISSTPGLMHQKGSKPVIVNINILNISQAE